MVKNAKQVALSEKKLSVEERNILSVAYKNVVGMKRNSRRLLHTSEKKELSKNPGIIAIITDSAQAARIKIYREKVENELKEPCFDVIKLIEDVLEPNAKDDFDSSVFYLKMKGDYYRYLCEFLTGAEKQTNSDKALDAYQGALNVATENMKVCDPVRLGLALNFSVFHYEIRDEPEKACEMAKKAFNDAINSMEDNQGDYKDATLILQLLKDNISLWTTEMPNEDDQEDA